MEKVSDRTVPLAQWPVLGENTESVFLSGVIP